MEWLNPPSIWTVEYSQEENYINSIRLLTVHVNPHTDFWRKSHNGCISDKGHFLYQNVSGDFEVLLDIEGRYADLYDHGGLMIRENEENWVKAGIEYVNGIANVSAVVTRDYSDWSVISLGNFDPTQVVHFKLIMKHKSFEIFYSLDGETYSLYRVGFLTNSENLKVGIMCAAPQSETGFDILFKNLNKAIIIISSSLHYKIHKDSLLRILHILGSFWYKLLVRNLPKLYWPDPTILLAKDLAIAP